MKPTLTTLSLLALCLLAGCVSTPMQHLDTAQWLYENGECYAARKICILKLKEDPDSEDASELLAKIHQKLDSKLAKPIQTTIGPPSVRGGVFPNWRHRDLTLIDDRWLLGYKLDYKSESEKILEKELEDLDNIVIPVFKIEDGSLAELATLLKKLAAKHDPGKRNLNITFIGKENNDLMINMDLKGLSLAAILDFLPRAFEIKIVRNKNTIKLMKEFP